MTPSHHPPLFPELAPIHFPAVRTLCQLAHSGSRPVQIPGDFPTAGTDDPDQWLCTIHIEGFESVYQTTLLSERIGEPISPESMIRHFIEHTERWQPLLTEN